MMSNSRRKKLAMLMRSLDKGDFASAQQALSAAERQRADASRNSCGAARYEPAKPMPIAQACPGTEALLPAVGGRGTYWRIHRSLAEAAADSLETAERFAAILRGARQRFDELEASEALCHAANGGPEDLLFMDTETCGLSSAAIFLIGMMYFHGGQLIFEQLFARDYAEEAAILHAFADRYDRSGVLVTFNGKSFDMNLIRERSAYHGIPLPDRTRPHLDLLHESRKRWRKQLPNCRLQTLEQYFFGRHRQGDIPGSAIPDAYHRFVATGDARQMRDVVHHNMLDMLTMAELVCLLLTGSEPT